MLIRISLSLWLALSAGAAMAQIRAFDNSKAIMPWIYNPAAEMSPEYQAYFGYDARGNSSFTPQSLLAGARLPILGAGPFKSKNGPLGVAGVQVLNTNQLFINSLQVQLNYAHQIHLNNRVKLAAGVGFGIFNMRIDQDELVYLDATDPMLQQGSLLFNLQLNTGLSVNIDDRMLVQAALPDLLKNGGGNLREAVLRFSYELPLNPYLNLIPAANLDTQNKDMIWGGDARVEWRETISLLGGADRYKYYGGILLNLQTFYFGYTYGQNYSNTFNHIESHQISLRLSTGRPFGSRGK